MKRNAVRRWRSFCGRQKMPPRKGWAAVYCRLSKEDEDKAAAESESIRNQRALLLDWAATHGYHVYKVYTDEDYSGIDRARPGFNAMLNDARQGKFEVILAKTQSRFTRDMELVERYLHGLFPEWGVRFIAVLDHVDTCDPAGKRRGRSTALSTSGILKTYPAMCGLCWTTSGTAGATSPALRCTATARTPPTTIGWLSTRPQRRWCGVSLHCMRRGLARERSRKH